MLRPGGQENWQADCFDSKVYAVKGGAVVAKKSASKKKATRRSQPDLTIQDHICDAALVLANEHGWDAVTMDSIASEINISFGEVVGICPTRGRLTSLLIKRIDTAVMYSLRQANVSESIRNRLFDVLMMRFDVLQKDRIAYSGLIKTLMRNPDLLLCQAPHVIHAMALVLTASGVQVNGLKGFACTQALVVVYWSVLRVWIKDESSDMTQTMATLDKELARLESVAEVMFGKPKP